jgi:hypothetical protein
MLRWVPVPVGPLANSWLRGMLKLIEGSPKAWMGSTTIGTENVIRRALPRDGCAELPGLLTKIVPAATAAIPTAIAAYLRIERLL